MKPKGKRNYRTVRTTTTVSRSTYMHVSQRPTQGLDRKKTQQRCARSEQKPKKAPLAPRWDVTVSHVGTSTCF